MARYWGHRGVTTLPCPLLTGAAALAPEIPWPRPVWVGHFLQAVAAEAEAGLRQLPPGMVALMDLRAVWPEGQDFMATRGLVELLKHRNADYWGADSHYGKPLTDTRLGRLIAQATKVTSQRIGGRGPRGYSRILLEPS